MEDQTVRYQFDTVEVQPAAFVVMRDGQLVELEPKAVRVLLYLIEHRDRAVSKEELMEAVWQGTAVTDNALTRVVAQIRRELGDDARQPRFIQTLPTMGYRFVAAPVSVRVADNASVSSRPRGRRSWVLSAAVLWPALAALLAIVAAAEAGLDIGGLRTRLIAWMRVPAPSIRLAVLPFENLTGDPEQEYLSDGLTQEMIAQLGRLHPERLSVIARTSVMRYKKSGKSIDQVGRELGADYVLEGSAQREAGRVRITAALIQVRRQTQLWAESFEGELAGTLALQSEVARRIAGALALKLLPAEQARLANIRSVNPEAHDAYLRGLHHWHRLTRGDLESAQKYFELALEKDPNYAPAYAGTSLVWAGLQQMGITSPREAGPRAKAAAEKAVALDGTVAEGHYALAAIKGWTDWDWLGAEPEFRRAIAINPSFPDARAYYSHLLMIMRRPEEAMQQIDLALQLDPFNPLFQSLYAVDLLFVDRVDDAIAQCRKTLRTAPDSPVALSILPGALFSKGMYQEAFAAWKTSLHASYGSEVERVFEQGYTKAGYRGAMRNVAEALVARSREMPVVPSMDIGSFYLEAGDKVQALDWLERALEERDPNLPYIGGLAPDSLRSEPRFQALLRRMNLPQ